MLTAGSGRSEAQFRSLFEYVPISICEQDFSAIREYLDGLQRSGITELSAYFEMHPEELLKCAQQVRIVDVNHATLEMYQAESKEQLQTDLLNVLDPEDLGSFKELLLGLARGETYFEYETVNYTLGRQRLTLLMRLTIPPEYEDTWTRVFFSILDITKRKETEAKLEQSGALFRALFDLSPDAVLVIDPHHPEVSWPIIDCNMAACIMNGYSREELIGHSIDILNTTTGSEAERATYLQRLRELGHVKIETQHRHKDGTIFPVEVSTTLITIGDRELVIGIDRDITQRKQAEEALRQSEERFKLMAWATKDAVWDWDLQTDQVWWGEGLQKIFHYSSEMTQTNADWWFEHIHLEDQPKVKRTIDQAVEGGMEFWSKEYRFQRKDGSYADIMDRGYILRNPEGTPHRMIGAMMDITERKIMESKLLESNEQMRRFLNELQRRNNETALLNEMGRLLQACQSTEEAYRIIGDLSQQLFPRTSGALYLLNAAHTLAVVHVSWGRLPAAEQSFVPSDCWALRSGQTNPLGQDPAGLRCHHVAEPIPVRSCCLLMQVQGETLGVLHLRSEKEEYLNDAKRQLAYTVAEQTGMALSNLNLRNALREQSVRDPLTGLFNRRYMEEALRQHLSRVNRYMHPLAIIMIDIDHFKSFNDVNGHAAGDLLLHGLGQLLQSHIRGEDIACRYGGEEFLLIMPDAPLEVARHRAEYLRRKAKELQVQDIDQTYSGITLSLGIAIYPLHSSRIETVLRAADTALYQAKQAGRDRVMVAE
jgi:diguanylate cyclase (GGDEF)-like protein/PAS domain S-box-containing protein